MCPDDMKSMPMGASYVFTHIRAVISTCRRARQRLIEKVPGAWAEPRLSLIQSLKPLPRGDGQRARQRRTRVAEGVPFHRRSAAMSYME